MNDRLPYGSKVELTDESMRILHVEERHTATVTGKRTYRGKLWVRLTATAENVNWPCHYWRRLQGAGVVT